MGDEPIRILLVEDDAEEAAVLAGAVDDGSGGFELLHETRLAGALERLAATPVDVVLLDLGLPDCGGLEAFARVRAQAPEVPVVVLADDEGLALKTVREGAQEYLLRGQVYNTLLVRAVRFAVERHRRLAEQDESLRALQEDMAAYERTGPARLRVTAELFGGAPLRTSLPAIFEALSLRYGELLDLALEERTYKVSHDPSGGLRALADQLGFLRAGPRDVIELHGRALRAKQAEHRGARAAAYLAEGRVRLVEIMGYLVSYYRTYSFAARGGPGVRGAQAGDGKGEGP